MVIGWTCIFSRSYGCNGTPLSPQGEGEDEGEGGEEGEWSPTSVIPLPLQVYTLAAPSSQPLWTMGQPLHVYTCVCLAICIGLGASDDKDQGSAGAKLPLEGPPSYTSALCHEVSAQLNLTDLFISYLVLINHRRDDITEIL